MSSTTIIIIVAVAVIWAILFAVFMKFNKKRQAGEQQFVQENANKAILHIYGKSVKVDGCLLYTSPNFLHLVNTSSKICMLQAAYLLC